MNQTFAPLVFEDTHFTVVDRNNQPWLRYPQIAGALNYNRPAALLDVYARHSEEFTASMTALVELPTRGGVQKTRIFSLRGAHLLGMLAKTEPAKRFRHWVLDILEGKAPAPAAQPDLFTQASQAAPDFSGMTAIPELVLLRQLYATQTRLVELLEAKCKPKAVRVAALPITPEEVAMARAMKSQGLSSAAIGRQLKRSTAAISFITRELH